METSVIVILVSYCPPVDGWIVLSSKPGTSKTINPLLEGFQRTTAGPEKKLKSFLQSLCRYSTLVVSIGYVSAP